MKTIDYKAYFHAGYKGAADFNANILEPLFGANNVSNDQNEYVQEEDKSFIQSIHRCGEYFLNGDPIEFFDITLTENCKIARNRQNIKKTVVRLMEVYSGAFIVFHYSPTSTKTTWRFSWVEKIRGNSDTSAPKRYTYLCGSKYSCRTIGDRFDKLLKAKNDNTLTVNSITNAFDVEALSEDFFKEYKVFYEDIVQYISGNRFVPKSGKPKEFELKQIESTDIIERRGIYKQFKDVFGSDADKAVRDYVKKLLGRLVFIQFLQKKGWLGISASQVEWDGGDTDFLSNTFSNATSDNKDNFVENILEDILFDSFNKPNSIRNGIKYPYLNGGLFERDKADELKVKLPRALFVSEKEDERKYYGKPAQGKEYDYTHAEGLFQFFDRYNFTIDENDPEDAIVGVDPEMLGKIFENLLEDNKDKGAFYTPKEIVQYMCRESLIAYLCNEIKGIDDDIRKLVEGTIEENNEAIRSQSDALRKAITEVKICDPAIGSGAFPMGLLNLLLHIRFALGETDRCQIKKDIILNNIYGVDIDRGAIDIARLRFWLAIMVDETEPSPLPNFDYKFMQGNSLLESYEGIDLSNLIITNTKRKDDPQMKMVFENEKDALSNIQNLMKEYFNLHDEKKKERKEEINIAVGDYLRCVTEGKDPEKQAEMLNIDFAANDKFFLWHLWFADVFSRPDKQGFDIIIGNPPYFNLAANSIYKRLPMTSNIADGVVNIAALFLYFSLSDLTNTQGYTTMIIPKSYYTVQSWGKLRKKNLKENVLVLANDVGKAFDKVGLEQGIVLYAKSSIQNNVVRVLNDFVEANKISQDYFLQQNIILTHATTDIFEVIKKIEKNKILLGNIADMPRGISENSNIYSNIKIKDYIQVLGGTNLKQYALVEGNRRKPNRYANKNLDSLAARRMVFHETRICYQNLMSSLPKVVAAIVPSGIPTDDTINNIIFNDTAGIPINLILAILNSNLCTFYLKYRLLNCAKLTVHLDKPYLGCIPIPNTFSTYQQPIISLTDAILAKKKDSATANTSTEERSINILVYKLYKLTYKEVKIIDPDLANPNNENYLSEEDYNKM